MRIISGDAKGRRLYTLPGRQTRPTLDRVKESLFNILRNRLMDAKVLDLFAGTGSLGLEAISRGASLCVFVDASRESISIVRKNIDMLGYNDYCEVYHNDAFAALAVLSRRNIKFNLIFLDPPYHKDTISKCLQKIGELDILEDGGIIVAEHDTRDVVPDSAMGLNMFRRVEYGDTSITFYSKEAISK